MHSFHHSSNHACLIFSTSVEWETLFKHDQWASMVKEQADGREMGPREASLTKPGTDIYSFTCLGCEEQHELKKGSARKHLKLFGFSDAELNSWAVIKDGEAIKQGTCDTM